jgi:hypothetical protein
MCDLCVSGVTETLQFTVSAGSLPDLIETTGSNSVTGPANVASVSESRIKGQAAGLAVAFAG